MRWLTGTLYFFYVLFAFYTLVVYALCYWVPTSHWLAGFLMISFPLVLAAHLGALFFWAVVDLRRALLPAFLLALSYPFWARTFQVPSSEQADTLSLAPPSLKVLSYNVYHFGSQNFYQGTDKSTPEQLQQWLARSGADVMCFQEFYNIPKRPPFDVVEQLRNAGYRYTAFPKYPLESTPTTVTGLAVFSKYPIIAKRDTLFGDQNGLIQVDIRWRQDTIRLIDVHLYSMTLKLDKLANQKEYRGVKRETRGTLSRIRTGFVERADQVDLLEAWIRESPYPLLVCGDFNETAYSYSYGRVRRQLTNAFEQRGRGFGFTFNQLPYFIRIDHQYYDPAHLTLTDFQTLRQVPYSDHYPLLGTYTLRQLQVPE
ncbi:endonuclease/exonuclease/phosphatase family protein [Rhabdobacter roseus]|uniref:Endonuclease/exonuclease/phosphatase (EEP) superfamily protein YafD n=1 Tax=Rhabdobacter roseus TaxID=1655419 RepID=A0A840TRN6_9BACT|nr:endonuclease/exonuclease/phosphatase family protein [Rhabdobacter roseus]MBB5284222.1 endonuclease/exonuclease/phosphatase (EEP) superfamily protein YafD [Rhabdobacter roseus]